MYKFSVIYNDGSSYVQNDEDVSVKNPEYSCYHDVEVSQVRQFTVGDDTKYLSVDLATGYFKNQDLDWFKIHDEELKDFKLVYFKRVTMALSDETAPGSSTNFFVGWEATAPDGQVVRKELVLS